LEISIDPTDNSEASTYELEVTVTDDDSTGDGSNTMSDSFFFLVEITTFNSAPTLASTTADSKTYNLFYGPFILNIACQDLIDSSDSL